MPPTDVILHEKASIPLFGKYLVCGFYLHFLCDVSEFFILTNFNL